MTRLNPEELERRRRAQLGRTITGISALLLMILSAVLPNIMVQAATVLPGRSLIPASHFFLIANPNAEAFSGAKSVADAGIGISITYLGLAFQQVGLLTGLASFWVLIVDDVGRWTRRLVMVSGGYAWVPTLFAGLIMVIGGRLARKRLVMTWYWESPEIVQP